MFACCSPFAYGTKKGTLQDKFYKPTFDQDPFEKVNFSLEHYLNRKGTHKMMIFIEKSLVFFATPKTGSTAYHQALGHKAEMFFSKSNQVKHRQPLRSSATPLNGWAVGIDTVRATICGATPIPLHTYLLTISPTHTCQNHNQIALTWDHRRYF